MDNGNVLPVNDVSPTENSSAVNSETCTSEEQSPTLVRTSGVEELDSSGVMLEHSNEVGTAAVTTESTEEIPLHTEIADTTNGFSSCKITNDITKELSSRPKRAELNTKEFSTVPTTTGPREELTDLSIKTESAKQFTSAGEITEPAKEFISSIETAEPTEEPSFPTVTGNAKELPLPPVTTDITDESKIFPVAESQEEHTKDISQTPLTTESDEVFTSTITTEHAKESLQSPLKTEIAEQFTTEAFNEMVVPGKEAESLHPSEMNGFDQEFHENADIDAETDHLEEFTLPEIEIKRYSNSYTYHTPQNETRGSIDETEFGINESISDAYLKRRFSSLPLIPPLGLSASFGSCRSSYSSYKSRKSYLSVEASLEQAYKPRYITEYEKRRIAEMERQRKIMEAALSHRPSSRTLELACPTLPYFSVRGKERFCLTERTKQYPKPSHDLAENYMRLLPPLRQVEAARPQPFDGVFPSKISKIKKPKLVVFPPPYKPPPKPISRRLIEMAAPRRNWRELRKVEIEAMQKVYQVSKAALKAVASERIQLLSKPKATMQREKYKAIQLKAPRPSAGRPSLMAPIGLGAAITGLAGLQELTGKQLTEIGKRASREGASLTDMLGQGLSMLSVGGGEGMWGDRTQRRQSVAHGEEMGRRRQSVALTPSFEEGGRQRRQSVMLTPSFEGGGGQESGGRRRQSVLLSTDLLSGITPGGGFTGLSEIAPAIKVAKQERRKRGRRKKKAVRKLDLTPPPPVIGGVVFDRRTSYTEIEGYPFGSLTAEISNKQQTEFQETSEELDAEGMRQAFSSRKSRIGR